MRFTFVIFLIIGCFIFSPMIYSQEDFHVIKSRVKHSYQKSLPVDSIVAQLISTFERDRWPYINYIDTSRTGFDHSRHLDHIIILSRAYTMETSAFFQNRDLENVIRPAVDFWIENNFKCENWWWNQIGVPIRIVEILFLLDNTNVLSAYQIQELSKISGEAHLDATGARPSGDRIKIAGILAKQLLYENNKEKFDTVIQVIEDEIKFSKGRGLQSDYSFHHRHDKVNNTLSYGISYALAFVEWANYVRGTQYDFSDTSKQILIDFFVDGIYKMMPFGKLPDPGAKNRSISRPGSLNHFPLSDLQSLLNFSDYRKAEIENILQARLNQETDHAEFNKFFWRSEYMSHQRQNYFISARMFSSRNRNMEVPHNSEGLKNHYFGNGSSFITLHGHEYFDIFPVFDFFKVPGTTLVQREKFRKPEKLQKEGIADFVGGVTNGRYGAAGFEYNSVVDTIRAKKSWFFFDEEIVCLGSGIKSWANKRHVVTTLNQTHLRGDIEIGDSLASSIPPDSILNVKNPQWILHDEVAYIVDGLDSVFVSNKIQTGSWYDINKQHDSPKDNLSKPIFKLWIDHGEEPDSACYNYVILPKADKSRINQYLTEKPISILGHSKTLHAVKHNSLDMVQAIFFEADSLMLFEGKGVYADSPGMIQIELSGQKIKAITLSDPIRKFGRLYFRIDGTYHTSHPNVDTFYDASKDQTIFSAILPDHLRKGESLFFELR